MIHLLASYGLAAAFGYLVCFCVLAVEAVMGLALVGLCAFVTFLAPRLGR